MTKLDSLREELRQRGCTNTQANTKVVAVVLDILTDAGNKYESIWEEEDDASERLKDLKQEISLGNEAICDQEYHLEKLNKQVEKMQKFKESLNECKNQESRDTMRAAQFFIDTVEINSKHDNTAFIIGLASILSSGEVDAIDQLSKINKKIPNAGKVNELKRQTN